jgi:hypothetical protein
MDSPSLALAARLASWAAPVASEFRPAPERERRQTRLNQLVAPQLATIQSRPRD